jgi:arsenate reductase
MDPFAVRVTAEAGGDISGHRSKLIEALPVQTFDSIITLCGHAREI